MPDSSSSATNKALATARATRGRQPARHHQGEPHEGGDRQHHGRHQRDGLDLGPPPEGQGGGAEHDRLQGDDGQHGQGLGRHQARAAERGRAEPLEHP